MPVVAMFSNTNRSILFTVIEIISSSVASKIENNRGCQIINSQLINTHNNFSDANKLLEKVLLSSQNYSTDKKHKITFEFLTNKLQHI